MARDWCWGICLLACLIGLGCSREKAPEATASPASEGTAWWKTEASPGQGGKQGRLAGEPLPGWKALPPLRPELAAKGQEIFTAKGCVSCHSFGKGPVVGPDLLGLSRRIGPEWVKRFISDPTAMLESDARAKEMLAKYLVKMPNLNLKPEEIRALLDYFRQQDAEASRGTAARAGK